MESCRYVPLGHRGTCASEGGINIPAIQSEMDNCCGRTPPVHRGFMRGGAEAWKDAHAKRVHILCLRIVVDVAVIGNRKSSLAPFNFRSIFAVSQLVYQGLGVFCTVRCEQQESFLSV